MIGQVRLVAVMVGVMVFLGVVVLIEPIKEGIDIARDASHLNCAAAGLSVGTEMSCIVVDWYLPVFVISALVLAGGLRLRSGSVEQ